MANRTIAVINGHFDAFRSPTSKEAPIINLMKVIEDIMAKDGNDDYHLRGEVLVPLIQAARAYLNYDVGNRLDMGTLDAMLLDAAKEAGIALDNL
jgi:hypothetical protein